MEGPARSAGPSGRKRLGGVALTAFVAFAVAAGAARGHDFEPGVKPVAVGIEPPARGVTVEARTILAPALFVRNNGDAVLEVLGSDGRPFIRIGPRGTEGNVASPDLYTSNAPVVGAPVPPRARPGAAPVWLRLASIPAWSWFEHRLDAARARPGQAWAIPARLGGREVRIRGKWVSTRVRGYHRTVIEAVRPQAAGVSFQVLANGPALLVQNAGSDVLEVEDASAKPFLRVGPGGVELRAADGAWQKMGAAPAWAWLERRAGWTTDTAPPGLADETSVTPIRKWSVRARLGDRLLVISGRVDWVPVAYHHRPRDDGGSTRVALIAVAVSLPLLVGVLILGARRGRARRTA